MPKLTPYIFVRDARKQAAFYASAFGGEIVSVHTFAQMGDPRPEFKDNVAHLVLQIGELQYFMRDFTRADEQMDGPLQIGNHMELSLEFPTEAEAQRVFTALADGGKLLYPFSNMPWGAMWGKVEDPFGIKWQISAPAPHQ